MNTVFKDQHPIKVHTLIARPMGIDTYQEPVIYMRSDCHVCRSEGFESQSRVQITAQNKSIIATLNVVHADYLSPNEAGLSDAAWRLLETGVPIEIALSHPEPVESFSHVRAKLFDNSLSAVQLESIFKDIAQHRFSDVQLSAFLAACTGKRMQLNEIVDMTRSMVMVGETIDWGKTKIFDKHCVGGLPGNRTTPIVVAIVTACGVTMPKTSSRAITSPSGTADTMETLAPVALTLPSMRQVVEKEGG
ncbi:MAG: thymidine phosphorylase, partial [Aliifodinibius sp.]|nr:thymidine phosphorylase [Fodinibius sp.]NIY30029.1 thymidine phosphorylase [Fodinibius sp.]